MKTVQSRASRASRQPSPNQALIAAAVLAAIAGGAAAQVQFGELPRHQLPGGAGGAAAVAVGDVDGDGDLDLVFGRDGQTCLCLNDGFGRFTDATAGKLPVDSDTTTAVALGDVDADGDLDLILGNYHQQKRLYRNNGGGAFTDVTAMQMPVDTDATTGVAMGDVDGDGDLDLVLGNSGQQDRLYLNNGSGVFTDVTATRMPVDTDATMCVALGDVDGDGDLDLVLGNSGYPYWGQNKLYVNDGSGTFNDVTTTQLPVGMDLATAVVLGDVDGDGDLDLVVANSGHWYYSCKYCGPSYWSPGNKLLLNNGAGTFTPPPAAGQLPNGFHGSASVTMGDVDGDGDLDLVFGNKAIYPYYATGNSLLLNNGSGTFVGASARLQNIRDWTAGVALGDLDGDGDLDLAQANLGRGRLFMNLQYQLDVEQPFRIGQPYALRAWQRHSPSSVVGFAFPAIALGTASIPLPPYGTLGIDPVTMVPLPAIAIQQPSGDGSYTFVVPNVPELIGLEIYSQALLVSGAGQACFSNVVPDLLSVDPVNLVRNGGFEQPVFAPHGWATLLSIPGWNMASGCGIDVWNEPDYALHGQLAELDSTCSSAFYQDVLTTPGRSYVLTVAYTPRPGVTDNAIQVDWNAASVFSLQQDGSALSTPSWSMHRALVTATAPTGRLQIADVSVSDSYGGLLDDISVVEVDFRNSLWLVGEVVHVPQDVRILDGYLLQAEAAHNNNNLAAKAAALAAFVSHVQTLTAGTVDPADATLLVQVANRL